VPHAPDRSDRRAEAVTLLHRVRELWPEVTGGFLAYAAHAVQHRLDGAAQKRDPPSCYRLRLTVTVKRAVAVLPLPSVAEHVTSVRPTLKRLPEAGRHETTTDPSRSSVAVTWYLTRTRFAFPRCPKRL
jgi:hypothetical protein